MESLAFHFRSLLNLYLLIPIRDDCEIAVLFRLTYTRPSNELIPKCHDLCASGDILNCTRMPTPPAEIDSDIDLRSLY